jgi:hypothetical protein
MEDLSHVKNNQAHDLIDDDEYEDFTEKPVGLFSLQNEQYELSIFALLDDAQNSTTSTAYGGNKDLMDNYSTETPQSSTLSSSIGSPLVTHIPLSHKQQIITSSSPYSDNNTISAVNIEQQMLPVSSDGSSKGPQKRIYAPRKRHSSPEAPMSLPLKRSRTKQTNRE